MTSLEKKGLNIGLTPPGGWWIEQVASGHRHRIEARGAEALVALLVAFRLANGVNAESDAEMDVVEAIIERNPKSANGITILKRGVFDTSKIELVSTWLDSVSMSVPEKVTELEAKERAAICETCEFNVSWRGPSVERNKSIEGRARLIRANAKPLSFDIDINKGLCILHGFHIGCAAFLTDESHPDKKPNAPQSCWLRKK